jgi:hypothetical protein
VSQQFTKCFFEGRSLLRRHNKDTVSFLDASGHSHVFIVGFEGFPMAFLSDIQAALAFGIDWHWQAFGIDWHWHWGAEVSMRQVMINYL